MQANPSLPRSHTSIRSSYKLLNQRPVYVITMLPTIVLAELITQDLGTIARGQVNTPSHLSGKSLTCSVRTCTSNVPLDELRHALDTDVGIRTAVTQLSRIIDEHEGDKSLLEKIEKRRNLLKLSENSFATGYGENSVWVQGEGVEEEYASNVQRKA